MLKMSRVLSENFTFIDFFSFKVLDEKSRSPKVSNKSASDFVERHERKEIQCVPLRMAMSDWTVPCYVFTALKTG